MVRNGFSEIDHDADDRAIDGRADGDREHGSHLGTYDRLGDAEAMQPCGHDFGQSLRERGNISRGNQDRQQAARAY
jgi:hypothetical protein